MAKIEVEGGKIFVEKAEQMRSLNTAPILFQLANYLRNRIRRRAAQGQGLEGPFEPYSTKPYYRPVKQRPIGKGGRRKSKTGRKLKTIFYEGGYAEFAQLTKGYAHPNLEATNNMFRSMQATVFAKGAFAYEAQVHFIKMNESLKALFNQATRPFFGATASDKQIMLNMFKEWLRQQMA